MGESPRRLATILAADIAGYSRLLGVDEEGTLARVRRCRRELIEPTVAEHHGRVVKWMGDGFLADFDSPVEAVHYGAGQTEARIELPPGRHTLQLVLGDADHIPFNPP